MLCIKFDFDQKIEDEVNYVIGKSADYSISCNNIENFSNHQLITNENTKYKEKKECDKQINIISFNVNAHLYYKPFVNIQFVSINSSRHESDSEEIQFPAATRF